MPAAENAFGEFLTAQRARVSPRDVGLPTAGSRRVKGLRREEVAVLAGVSADYYARLEQGRERTPSAQVVDAICTALQLGPDARAHAFRLARLAPATRAAADRVGPDMLRLLESMPGVAAYVVNPAFRIVAANPVATQLLGPEQMAQGAVPYLFADAASRTYFVDWEHIARAAVSALRLAVGYAPPHPEVTAVVARMKDESPDFARLWQDHRVTGLTATVKRIDHPAVGRLELVYQTFESRDVPGQQLTVATAAAGSASADSLTLLGTIAAGANQGV
ncbi:helix-turn-helix domain-containing protein [Promicromonospora sp. NPDC057488]|uniref:helix-turn-helix domain-containing protein n=1 Tax=Promicromonospora sp. NPDC057488 TaxID=3346147 RepID=UPI00367223E6